MSAVLRVLTFALGCGGHSSVCVCVAIGMSLRVLAFAFLHAVISAVCCVCVCVCENVYAHTDHFIITRLASGVVFCCCKPYVSRFVMCVQRCFQLYLGVTSVKLSYWCISITLNKYSIFILHLPLTLTWHFCSYNSLDIFSINPKDLPFWHQQLSFKYAQFELKLVIFNTCRVPKCLELLPCG